MRGGGTKRGRVRWGGVAFAACLSSSACLKVNDEFEFDAEGSTDSSDPVETTEGGTVGDAASCGVDGDDDEASATQLPQLILGQAQTLSGDLSSDDPRDWVVVAADGGAQGRITVLGGTVESVCLFVECVDTSAPVVTCGSGGDALPAVSTGDRDGCCAPDDVETVYDCAMGVGAQLFGLVERTDVATGECVDYSIRILTEPLE